MGEPFLSSSSSFFMPIRNDMPNWTTGREGGGGFWKRRRRRRRRGGSLSVTKKLVVLLLDGGGSRDESGIGLSSFYA